MNKWKKIVCVIAAVIAFIMIQMWFKHIERWSEEENHVYEVARQEREQYDKLISYCKEHEDMYMEISEQVFGYVDEGLSVEEACAAMENNATSEQKEILEQIILKYPGYSGNFEDSAFKELAGNGLYYFMKDGYVGVKAIYIHEYSEETEEYILSIGDTIKEKINDHLYVCYTWIPYT